MVRSNFLTNRFDFLAWFILSVDEGFCVKTNAIAFMTSYKKQIETTGTKMNIKKTDVCS